jgi:hypothetical protein
MNKPAYGWTKHHLPVHAQTLDHHRPGFNKAVAVALTSGVGNMRCFWVFNLLALLSLPATFHLMGVIPLVYHAHGLLKVWNFCLSYGWIFLITWVCQNYIQLVLLPALMVGQNLQNAAADARSSKTFEDTEKILDALDIHTQGGLSEILRAIEELRNDGTQAVEVPPGQVPPRLVPGGYKRPPGVSPEAQA